MARERRAEIIELEVMPDHLCYRRRFFRRAAGWDFVNHRRVKPMKDRSKRQKYV